MIAPLGGIPLWSIVTFDRVECTPASIVVHVSSETKARAAEWMLNAENSVAAGKRALEVFKTNEGDITKTTKDLVNFAFETLKGRKPGAP